MFQVSVFSAGGAVKTKHGSRCPNCGYSMVNKFSLTLSMWMTKRVSAGRVLVFMM